MSTVSIELELPFGLRLPDGQYNCRLGDNDFEIHILRVGPAPSTGEIIAKIRANPTTGEVQTSGLEGVAIPGVTELHSRLAVKFGHVSNEADPLVLAAQQREMGRRFINAFLDVYGYFFSQATVRPLEPSEFYKVRFGRAVRHTVKTEIEPRKGMLDIQVTFGDYPLTIQTEPLFAENEINRFCTLVRTQCEVPLFNSLILNSQSLIGRGDYRLAVIEAGTSLDVLIEEVAIGILASQGVNRTNATLQLEPMSSSKIANDIIEPCWHIQGTQSWVDYRAKFRQLRNSVVHDGLQPDKAAASAFAEMVMQLRDEFKKAGLLN